MARVKHTTPVHRSRDLNSRVRHMRSKISSEVIENVSGRNWRQGRVGVEETIAWAPWQHVNADVEDLQ